MRWRGKAWERWWMDFRLNAQQFAVWSVLASVPLFVVGIAWVLWLIGASGREHLWQYTWAAFWSSGGGIFWDWSNYTIFGQQVQMDDLQAYEWLRANIYHGRSWLRLFDHFVWAGFVAWLGTLASLWLRFYFFLEDRGETLRGTHVVDAKAFTARAREHLAREMRNGAGLGIELGNLRIPRALERGHILVTGSTGTGKTTLLRQVLRQLALRDASVVCYDPEGEFVSEFYSPERGDVILNPTDARAARWAVDEEITGPGDYPTLAASLLLAPRQLSPTDEFWLRSARQVFVDLVSHAGSGADPRKIGEALTWPSTAIVATVQGTPSANLLSPRAPGQMSGILAGLASPAASLLLLGDDGPLVWSARRWAETRMGWLFISSTQAHREATLLLTSAWLTLLTHRLLDTPLAEAQAREVWIIADEVQTLRRLEALELLLTQGAKRGVRALLGFQAVSQLRDRYGADTATTMLGQPSTNVMLRSTDVETAKWIADRIGQREREAASDSVTAGLMTVRDSLSSAIRQVTDHAILPSEIMDLPNLRGYVAAAGLGVGEIELTYTPPPAPPRVAPYVPRPVPLPSTPVSPGPAGREITW